MAREYRTPIGVAVCADATAQGAECVVVCDDGSLWGLVPGEFYYDNGEHKRKPTAWVEMLPIPGSRRGHDFEREGVDL
jgi:hypothetical protein